MENETISAASNPNLVNKLVADVLREPDVEVAPIQLEIPSDVIVNLPGGYVSPDGEVHRTAEVRELTGKDEEAIVKASSVAKAMAVALSRGTVKIGELTATEEILDQVLSADRDTLMLGIYRATFGNKSEVLAFCNGCKDRKTVEVDVKEDVPIVLLKDPIEDRQFTVKGRKHEYVVMLPEGRAQKDVANNTDKNNSELDTLLLEYCLVQIDGRPVRGKTEIQNIGLADRRVILKEIVKRNPGPKYEDLKTTCPDCGGEVVVPINIGTLFRF
jgi:hypothetical protein